MRNFVFILFIMLCVSLWGESISIQTDLGGMTVTVQENSAGNSKVNLVDEIAARVEMLETKYNSKLNKLDQKKTGKIINEIYELLAMMPEDISYTVASNESSTTIAMGAGQQKRSMDADVSINIQMQEDDFEADPVVAEVENTNQAMSSSDFNRLKSNVENESFADDQMSVIRIAAKSKYFSIDQLIELLSVFTFEEDKIEVVRIVYPKIVDPENAHNLLGSFTYSEDKATVEEIISQ